MTKEFIQYLNEIHKKCWEESDDGEIEADEIKKIIKTVAGYTVVEKYWEELHDFGRIEQVPETQTWIVKKPEKAGVNVDKDDRKRKKTLSIPENVLQAGEQYGVNFSAVFTEAVIQEVSNIEQFVEDYLGDQYSEQEADFIFEMIKKELHLKKGDRQQMARRDRRRRQIYKDIFEEDRADSDKIEELRQKSFELQEMLEL
jgi:hypothetical protein